MIEVPVPATVEDVLAECSRQGLEIRSERGSGREKSGLHQ